MLAFNDCRLKSSFKIFFIFFLQYSSKSYTLRGWHQMDYCLKIFLSKTFVKFARKERISMRKLLQVFEDLSKGNIDADYGGGVIKQRIARADEGKSGGHRAIIFYHKGDKTFFMHGFSKKDKRNIDRKEEKELKKQARIMLSLTDVNGGVKCCH
jgi:hypothetical protein